jgi:KDO2-lipid IV(A) lauroyltransferase
VRPATADSQSSEAPLPPAEKPTAWVRAIGILPMFVLHGIASLIGWLAFRVFPYRTHVVRANLTKSFPDLDEPALRELMRHYYRGFADVLFEIVKLTTMSAEDLRRRVVFVGAEAVREALANGNSVILLAAHQCNWEWMLQKAALDLGYPLDAAYKPLVNQWGDREMLRLRRRFGVRMIPGQDLLADILKRGRVARAIALLADQEPKTAERQYWTRFLNRDTAFYVGPEEIARVTRYPVFFAGMKRLSRGRYELRFTQLSAAKERFAPGELTERYAREVEKQILDRPADWPWSHKRWKLKRSVYGNK